jgi:hypothetical protein
VCLISKFVLFLGHPTYALTVVLCTLLISAGVGSYWSGRSIGDTHAALQRAVGVAVMAIAVLGVAVEVVLPRLLDGASFATTLLVTVGLLGPVGFLMGMPFPLGLRLLGRTGPEWAQLIPWVWGINGASSVLGSVLAISLAINFGFRMTLVAGVVVYAAALGTARYLAGGARAPAPAEVGDRRWASAG